MLCTSQIFSTLLHRKQDVQECDTTKAQQPYSAGYKIILLNLLTITFSHIIFSHGSVCQKYNFVLNDVV